MRQSFKAERRWVFKGAGLHKLRKEGRVPAIVYGKHMENVAVHVQVKDVQRWVYSGHVELIDLDIADVGTYPVILSDIQRDPLTGEWLHADFHRVQLDEPVRAKVPLEYSGIAPGVKAGGILQIHQTHLEVEALPEKVPSVIHVEIGKLQIGHHLSASDIKLDSSVRMISDAGEVLVSIVAPRTNKDGSGDESAENAG